MSGLEPLAVITVLAPALKSAAELVNKARKKRKKRDKELQWYQQEIETTLAKAELEIMKTYHGHIQALSMKSLDDQFRQGDEICNPRIKAQVAEAESMKRVLELTLEYEPNAVGPIKTQFGVAASIPRETTRAMNELSLRIQAGVAAIPQALPHPREAEPPSQMQFSRSTTVVENPISPDTTFMGQPHSQTQFNQSTTVAEYPFGPDTTIMSQPHPQTQFGRSAALEHPISSDTTTMSQYRPKSHPAMGPPSPDIPSSFDSSASSPHISSGSSRDPTAGTSKNPRHSTPADRHSVASIGTTSTANSHNSEFGRSPQQKSNSISRGFISSSGPRTKLAGRPGRDNSYHGFCQGAWTSMEDPSKGMQVISRLSGLFGATIQVLNCRKCGFKAVPYHRKEQKGLFTDSRVRIAKCGIRYLFSFLVKSHKTSKDNWNPYLETVDKIEGRMNEESYGCLFCCAEGWKTNNYGGAESLLNHIFHEHRGHPTPGIDRMVKCIWGREPFEGETFDIHLSNAPSLPPQQSTTSATADLTWDFEQSLQLIDIEPMQPQPSASGNVGLF